MMIKVEEAINFATDNGVCISDDYKVESKGCAPAKRAFYARKGDVKIEVTQGRTRQHWEHGGDSYYWRGEAIAAAVTKLTGEKYVA